MRTMSSPKGVQKQSHGCSCQGCKTTNHTLRNPPEPSESCIRNLHQHTHRNLPEPSGTCLRNLHQHRPEPSGTFLNLSGTYTSTHRNPPETFRNLPPEPTAAHTGTLRNLPEPASGTYTSTHRNPPEPSGTCLRNLHQHTPEPSGTFRNLPPEPTPAHTGTLRNLPEPASGTYTSTHRNPPEPSGTCLRNLHHQHTPEPAGTGTQRSLSGLKTPLAYAVGEKDMKRKDLKTSRNAKHHGIDGLAPCLVKFRTVCEPKIQGFSKPPQRAWKAQWESRSPHAANPGPKCPPSILSVFGRSPCTSPLPARVWNTYEHQEIV